MKKTVLTPTRRCFLTGASALGLAACGGQTDQIALRDPDEEAEGGISGTGIRGSGFVGTVLGFGSILINGERVETPAGMRRADAFGAIGLDDLKPGHSVTVQTDGLVAHHLAQHHPVIGRVDAVLGRGVVQILGARVLLPAGVTMIVGEHARVSGIWDGGVVRATRVDPAPIGIASVSGTVTPTGINGVAVEGILPRPGVFATATGTASGGVLRADAFAIGRFTNAGAPLKRISAEGYLERAPLEASGFLLSGFGHSFDAAAQLAPVARGRHLFRGRYEADFEVAEAIPLPETEAEKRALLLSDSPFEATIGTR